MITLESSVTVDSIKPTKALVIGAGYRSKPVGGGQL